MFRAWVTCGAPKASWFCALPVHNFSIASLTIPVVKKVELEGQGQINLEEVAAMGHLLPPYICRGEGGDGNCSIISCQDSLDFRLIQNLCISFSNWDRNPFFGLPMRWQTKMCDKLCVVRPRATSAWGQPVMSHRLLSLINISSLFSTLLINTWKSTAS